MKTIFLNPNKIVQKWYLIDAEGQTLGHVAVKAANILRGKNKACFTPHQNVGDFVIITNSEKIIVTGQKRKNKLYYRHTGYPGGLNVINFEKMIVKKPYFPVEEAIRGMLPKNRLGRKLFRNLKVYSGTNHPHSAQKPEKI